MAKYDPLHRFLADSGRDEITLEFESISAMVSGGLPRSAHDKQRRMWWANTADSHHVQAAAWLAAGYVVDAEGVDYSERTVRFVRHGPQQFHDSPGEARPGNCDTRPGSGQRDRAAEPETSEPSSAPSPESAAGEEDQERTGRSQLGRARAYLRRGISATVLVLVVLAAGTVVGGLLLKPDTSVPQPGSSSVEVDFSPAHPARSPVAVGVELTDDVTGGYGSGMTMAITLAGADLAQKDWSVIAEVPAGVQLDGQIAGDPRTGRVANVTDARTGQTTTFVYLVPGPMISGKYSVILTWDNLSSGPMQVRGPYLAAAFPDVIVKNITPSGSHGQDAMPMPPVTAQDTLETYSDYVFLGGMPPDHFDNFAWVWKTQAGHVNEGDIAIPLAMEAQSPADDQQTHTKEFYSGIAFGIAAAAFIACIQEFMTTARSRHKSGGNPDPAS
jgi:hypothetical protein